MPSPVAPLESSYATKVTMVLLSLCPYIVVTTAATLMQKPLIKDLHTSKTALEMAGGLANPGYAFGAVLAALLIQLGPTFALVELLRSEAAFLVAPILLHVSLGQGTERPQLDHGISVAGWGLVVILVDGLAVSAAIWRASGARSPSPDLRNWLEEGNQGLDSPPVLAEVRG